MQSTLWVSTSLLLALLAEGGECEPSRLTFGRVDINTPSLDPWYLKSLTSAGISDIVLPGYIVGDASGSGGELTGPISLWEKLPRADRDSILGLAASNSNRIHMQVELNSSSSEELSLFQVEKACRQFKALGLDGIIFSNSITSDDASLCSVLTSGAVMVSSPDPSVSAPSEVEHFLLETNEQIMKRRSGDLLMLCDGGTCANPTQISDGALIYLNVVPGLSDQYLETFLTEDLPHLNGLFDANDRPSRVGR